MNICDLINKKYLRLSKGQRKVAQFILEHPQIIATNIASDVGRLAGVSESTVIRFCYAIDLSGFGELQKRMQEYVSVQETITAPKIEKSSSTDSIKGAMLTHVKQISNIMQTINSKQILKALMQINKSSNLYIAGFREYKRIAGFLHNQLMTINIESQVINQEDKYISSTFNKFSANSTLIIFVNEQKFEDEELLLQYAFKNNTQIICISDENYHSYSKYHPINISLGEAGAIKSIAAYSFVNSLALAIAEQSLGKAQ